MKTFDSTVGLWVIAGCPVAVYAEELHHLIPHVGLKLATTVGSEVEWHTEPGDPSTDEGTCNGLGGDVSEGYSFRPACEFVYAGEEVPISTGVRKRADDVDVYVVKPVSYWCEGSSGRVGVAVYL